MSDWDNLNKDSAVPRNDPNTKRDTYFEDDVKVFRKNVLKGAKATRVFKHISNSIEEPKSKEERKKMVHQLMTNRNLKSKTGIPRRKTGLNGSSLTAVNVILYFIALIIFSPIISTFKGSTSLIIYVGLWFVVRNIAKSFLSKF